MKKKCRKTWNGLLPNIFFSLSHNTADCIVTGKAGRQRATTRCNRPRYGRPTREACGSARAWLCQGESRYKFVSWLRGGRGGGGGGGGGGRGLLGRDTASGLASEGPRYKILYCG